MTKTLTLAACLLLGLTAAVRAEPIPAADLDAEYQSCLGGEQPQQNPQRAAYCGCVRSGMQTWDMATYARIAQDAQTMNAQNPPPELNQLAQSCIARVLH